MLCLDTGEVTRVSKASVHLTHLTAQQDIGVGVDEVKGIQETWSCLNMDSVQELHKWEQQLLSPGHKLESTCHQE